MGKTVTKVVAWDFDGVINSNMRDGDFLWYRNFERDLGLPLEPFLEFMFEGRFASALSGAVDLLCLVEEWLAKYKTDVAPNAFLRYWFSKDAFIDHTILEIVEQLRHIEVSNVIATNNEVRRTKFIAHELGLASYFHAIFSAGELGVAKPQLLFFEKIQSVLNVEPKNILLVDDLTENLCSAKHIGWQTHLYHPGEYEPLRNKIDLFIRGH